MFLTDACWVDFLNELGAVIKNTDRTVRYLKL